MWGRQSAEKWGVSGRGQQKSEIKVELTKTGLILPTIQFLRLLGKGVIEAEASVVRVTREKDSVSYGIKFAAMKTVYPTGEIKSHWL